MCPLPPIRKPLLCYVTDRRSLANGAEEAKKLLLEKIAQAAQAGVAWIQLREKDLSGRALAELVMESRRQIGTTSRLVVNDRLDVAIANGAGGVHLGENSLHLAEAKRLARARTVDFIVGASVHSFEAAREAEMQGADYLVFGPIFATPSKADFGAPQGLSKLREVCQGTKIPVIAIGGITAGNVAACLEAGASGIAAIRLFQEAADVSRIAARFGNPG